MNVAEKVVLDCNQVRMLLLYEFQKQSATGLAVDIICGMRGPASYDTAMVSEL